MVILAEDGTWHRPMTTYELGAFQGFPSHLLDGRPFQIEGCSDAKARESEDDEDHQPETLERTENDEGQKVWKFKLGKLKITATYINDPSDEAIIKCNNTYKNKFHDFNK